MTRRRESCGWGLFIVVMVWDRGLSIVFGLSLRQYGFGYQISACGCSANSVAGEFEFKVLSAWQAGNKLVPGA